MADAMQAEYHARAAVISIKTARIDDLRYAPYALDDYIEGFTSF